MSDVYDARTLEDIKRDGYPPIREDELRREDRRLRDRSRMIDSGLWGGCVVV